MRYAFQPFSLSLMQSGMLVAACVGAGVLSACNGDNASSAGAAVSAQSKQLVRSQKAQASDYQAVVQELYVAYYGRPADPAGLAYWEGVLLADNAPTDIADINTQYTTNAAVQSVINSFGTSAESTALYGTGNASSFVTAIYQNVLGRAPDGPGLTYWAGLVGSNAITQGDAALSIAASAASEATTSSDEQIVSNRLAVATYFTAQVVSQNAANGYSGSAANTTARSMLGAVTATTNMTAYDETVAATVTSLIPVLNYPADLFGGLPNWEIDLPIGPSNAATEITQPQLATYAINPYFVLNAGKTGADFRAIAGGARTSTSTAYSRSELREMSGASLAAWSCTSGTNELTIDQRLLGTTTHKAQTSIGQIHDAENDIVMIKYIGPAYPSANGTTDTGTVNANFNNDTLEIPLDTNYTLGDEMTVDILHNGGTNTVTYHNLTKGTTQVASAAVSGTTGPCYFKVGVYIAACTLVDINGNTNAACVAKGWPSTEYETDPNAASTLEVYSIVDQ